VGDFTVFDVRPGRVDVQVRSPGDYGIRTCSAADLSGGDSRHNALALRKVFEGEDRGPHRDCLLLGTALALEVAGEVQSPRDGLERAATAIDSGSARRVLETLTAFSSRESSRST
jgi:anthranilate phosphoribosyltransferase